MLNDPTIKGQEYTAQRELLLTTQELFARQKLWGGKMESAAMRHDMNGIRIALPFLENLRKDMSKLYSHVDKAQQPPQIDVIIKGQTELLRQTYYGITHIAEIAANIDETQRQIEDGDWSNQLRSGMMTTLQLLNESVASVTEAAGYKDIAISVSTTPELSALNLRSCNTIRLEIIRIFPPGCVIRVLPPGCVIRVLPL